ncbi:hypothetical protein AKO1_001629 [Acrasis kona]|uniref:Methyltransferase type 11 domain-containing protein n=1 Tax=Acrasis kona TaxID=1008807 RepID=A0AAW2ZBJ6_9EUKA
MSQLTVAKNKFTQLCENLNERDFEAFKGFLVDSLDLGCGHDHHHHHDEPTVDSAKTSKLDRIIDHLRSSVNVYAEAPEENIVYPKEGKFDGYTNKNTIHVDGFLYSDDVLPEFQQSGAIPTSYCKDCNSKNISDLNFISHSFSTQDLDYVFSKHVLGRYNLTDLTIMDVGSRLGAVLYYAHLFTSTKKLIGVEINPFFAKLQQTTLNKFKMQNRVQIINEDFLTLSQTINECDILIMHNVFEWFCSQEEHKNVWYKLKNQVLTKKGLKLLCCPPIGQSLSDAGIKDINIDDWVKVIPLTSDDSVQIDAERQSDFCLYEIK